jgi:2,3-dihydroxybenzoate-AMP ligase
VVTEERRLTYRKLDVAADRLATGLHRLGIRPHDRVVVQLPNVPEFITTSIALFRLGALPVFALPAHRSSEIKYLCQHAEAVAYVIPDVYQKFDYRVLAREVGDSVASVKHIIVMGNAGEFQGLQHLSCEPEPLAPPKPDDVAFFLLSGGTTGSPKLIPRTHDDYAYQLRASAQGLGFDEKGVYLATLPIGHNAALGCPGVLGTLRMGGKIVLSSSPSPADVFPLIEEEGVTLTTLITPLVTLWVQAAELFQVNFNKLLLQVGGAKLEPELGWKVQPNLGCRLTHWFGMAEGFLSYTRVDDAPDVIIHTQGRPLCPSDEIRVVDALGNDVTSGEVGELLVRGPYTICGYYKADEYNYTAFTSDGYLRTGDLVRITASGNMVVEGRLKEVINRGGEKLSPEDLESHLLAHPGICQAGVIPVGDPVMGERICACVVCSGGEVTLEEVRAFLRSRGLADYKVPDRLEIMESLPRTSLGKINRWALRDAVVGKASAAAK